MSYRIGFFSKSEKGKIFWGKKDTKNAKNLEKKKKQPKPSKGEVDF